jgi:hypothetical protein
MAYGLPISARAGLAAYWVEQVPSFAICYCSFINAACVSLASSVRLAWMFPAIETT